MNSVYRVANRYRLSTVGPDQVWRDWTLVTEKTMNSTLRRLEEIQRTFDTKPLQKLTSRIQLIADNVKWLTQHYNDKFKTFQGESQWTPSLRVVVKSLAEDSQLMRRLEREIYVDTDLFSKGVQQYFDRLTDSKLGAAIDKCAELAYDYSIGDLDDPAPAITLAELLAKRDFSKEESYLKKGTAVFPEIRIDYDGYGSYDFYSKWVRRLVQALREENPEAVAKAVDDWEDAHPLWVKGYEIDSVDDRFLTGKQSALYWYRPDFDRMLGTLEDAAKSV